MTFGEIIRKSRESKKISQNGLVAILKKNYGINISASYISMIENNTRVNITANIIDALLDSLELPLEAVSSLFTKPVRNVKYTAEVESAAVHETQAQYSVSPMAGPFHEYDSLPPEAKSLLSEYYEFLLAKYCYNKTPL